MSGLTGEGVKTGRELRLEELLSSARAIAERDGTGTAWKRFADAVAKEGINGITPRTFRVLPSDIEAAEPYKQRVVDEKRELDIKGAALANFVGSPAYNELGPVAQNHLDMQLQAMTLYSRILKMRIESF